MKRLNRPTNSSNLQLAIEHLHAQELENGTYAYFDAQIHRWIKAISVAQLEYLGEYIAKGFLTSVTFAQWCELNGAIDWSATNRNYAGRAIKH